MKVIIYIDLETGEVFFYTPSEEGESILVNPRVKKHEGEAEEDEERTH